MRSSCSSPVTHYRARRRSPRAFTLVEVLIAIAILAIALGAMGVIFRMSLEAYRASSATAEIMRKLRAITEQLDSDFKGLRKDGVIFLVSIVDDPDPTKCRREDRIVFFANGDFQSYDDQTTNSKASVPKKAVRGNVARISYMLASDSSGRTLDILARSQHIVTADPDFANKTVPSPVAFPDFDLISGLAAGAYDPNDYMTKNNTYEYDTDGLQGWWDALQEDEPPVLPDYGLYAMLSTCTDIEISGNQVQGGLTVDVDDPAAIHLILAEGVTDFSIQGWCPTEARWYPSVDPNMDGDVADSDFNVSGGVIDTTAAIGTMWKRRGSWFVTYSPSVKAGNFGSDIPGMGKVLKFTFTLYDSRRYFKEGRKFTHMVYIGEN